MNKVIVLSRAKARNLTYNDFSVDRIIISISSIGDDTPDFNLKNGSIKDILYLHFNDEEIGEKAITTLQAEQIAEFINNYKEDLMSDKIQQVVVHCDAGVSRSAGVGAAILCYLTGSDMAIFDNPIYTPNVRCYRETLNALMKE